MKIALLLLPLTVIAHDIWIEKMDNHSILHYGHLHISKAHQGSKNIPYKPKNVKEILCKKNSHIKQLKNPGSYPVSIAKTCDILYMKLDNGYFTKTPYGTKNIPKNKTKLSLKSWKSIESVKRVDNVSDALLSSGLELVMVKRPSKVGEKATLQVYYNRKPLSGIPVAYDGNVRGVSNKEGKINIRIRHAGLQNIQATYKQEAKDKTLTDEMIQTTSLNFEVIQ